MAQQGVSTWKETKLTDPEIPVANDERCISMRISALLQLTFQTFKRVARTAETFPTGTGRLERIGQKGQTLQELSDSLPANVGNELRIDQF